jgi:hypothetical protein
VLPEVFECPRCERQFVIETILEEGAVAVNCPQCGRYLGERDVAFVLRSELDELVERLDFERVRLESDAATYGMSECEAEMKLYGREIPAAVTILREAIGKLRHLAATFETRPADSTGR